MSALNAVSPIDGRYHGQTQELSQYFSEFALIKYRVYVEIEYLLALQDTAVGDFQLTESQVEGIQRIHSAFTLQDAQRIKDIEKVTNHDVKAVEYFIKEKLQELSLSHIGEWVHFGLTSQDINNTAFPLMMKDAWIQILRPAYIRVIELLTKGANDWKHIPMLSRTHGQPASPSLLGKEIMVFVERLEGQIKLADAIPWQGKFGGAVGNMNAHFIAFPQYDWHAFAKRFLQSIGLERQLVTTQIEHYDMMAAHFQAISRINVILTDLCRDIWQYISMEFFLQKKKENEVGSSAMPHKVNPIDFENAEGNLAIANALFQMLAGKLPISRLHRDLTDSTVLRNVGVPYAHSLLACKSIEKGWGKLIVNESHIVADLKNNSIVLAEAIQTILRREQFEGAYEALKSLTRGSLHITPEVLNDFVDSLPVSSSIKEELRSLQVTSYTGVPNF